MSLAPPEVRPDEIEQTETAVPWLTVVWNDPINLMSYVTWVFITYFKVSQTEAERLMLAVHHDGRAVVSSGDRESVERDVQAMHAYGLWATAERQA
ncbi:MAG: ATP-dependent Clp protease adapter ClpS [Actinobacteria bacterium]|nr:ATP-dependent Clp protease adapter ClpS [Actinomycetota bacterium]